MNDPHPTELEPISHATIIDPTTEPVGYHTHDGIDSPKLPSSGLRYVLFKVLGPSTFHTVSTTVGGDLEMPFSGTIAEIGAYVDTAGVTGTGTIDVNKNGTTIMATTKITLDTTEKTSRTAATAPVLTTTTVAAGDILTVDIDVLQTTPAKGLTLRIGFLT